MLFLMRIRQWERFEGYSIYLMDNFPALTEISERTYIGMFAWTCPSVKIKWIKKRFSRNIGAGYCTPGDLARDYLSIKFGKKRRPITKEQIDVVTKERSAPLYANPCSMFDATYLDVKSAYWTILSAVGWDVDYQPGQWLAQQSDVWDCPFPEDKLARNCLVSLVTNGELSVWDGERLTQHKKPNQFVNYQLWALVMDVLNGFATDMIRMGATYAHTDGFIIPTAYLPLADELAKAWGLPLSIKHQGKCAVRNVGFYDFVGFKSRKPRNTGIAQFNKVYNPGVAWLRKNFRLFAEQAEIKAGLY